MGRNTLKKIRLDGSLLTCQKKNKAGRCVKYVQTCDSDDCITESPKHPATKRKKKKKKKTTKPRPKSKIVKSPVSASSRATEIWNRNLSSEELSKLLQIDMVYDTDLESSIKRILAMENMPSDTKYYLRMKSAKRTYVDSKTPTRGSPYVRIDRGGRVTRIDAAGKTISSGYEADEGAQKPTGTTPPNAERWEIDLPPIYLPRKKGAKEPGAGEYLYPISYNIKDRRGGGGNDYLPVVGYPVKAEKLDFMQLFVHKDPQLPKLWVISDGLTGRSLVSGETKKQLFSRLKIVEKQISDHPTDFMPKWNATRKIRDYPHLREQFDAAQKKLPEGAAAPLSGVLLTCDRWIVVGKGENEMIRCGAYKRTCPPGDKDCIDAAEPKKAKPKKKIKTPAERSEFTPADIAATEEPVLHNIAKYSRSVDVIASSLFLAPPFVAAVVKALEAKNLLMMNTIKGEKVAVITPAGKYAIGIEKEPTPDEGMAAWLQKEPFSNEEVDRYKKHIKNYRFNINAEFRKSVRDKEIDIEDRMKSQGIEKMPSTASGALAEYRRWLYFVYALRNITPEAEDEIYQEWQAAHNKLRSAIESMKPKEPVQEPVKEPKPESAWMAEKPFTEEDTHDFNRYTFYPIKDLNAEFEGMIKPKLEEVDRQMKKYAAKEIPAEVQTALIWYRRRSYEYLKRKIFSRNNAPGAAIVGPSKYNQTKHNKVIAADQKYYENLQTSGKKLDAAIRKHIAVKPSGKKAVSKGDLERWEAVAIKTKRTAFGKLGLEHYLETVRKIPESERNRDQKSILDEKSTFRPKVRAIARNLHARIIEDAFERGVTIDADVLAEYPDLARPKIDVVKADRSPSSHSNWLKWEKDKPPILLNPDHKIPAAQAYLVQDRSQRKSKERGWDYSVVDALPIKFSQAEDVPLIVHKSVKTPGTFDVTHVESGAVMASGSNPLDSKTKAIEQVKDWIARDMPGFRQSAEKASYRRDTADYPHFHKVFHSLKDAKQGTRRHIFADYTKPDDLTDLSGIGNILQALNALAALAAAL